MHCPKCLEGDTKVVDSREFNNNKQIRRRRSCEVCDYRFSTFEKYAEPNFMVEKKQSKLEPYCRSKVERGIMRALEKRNISTTKVQSLIDNLEQKWLSHGKKIPSQVMGEDIMKALLDLDQVAYIRFASVYRAFSDVDSFKKELDIINEKAT
jgi:transcriptional repressor NrdR